MNDNEIMCALVRRMWRDGIVANRQYADAENVARQAAIPRSEEGRAKDLLTGEMLDDTACPLTTIGSGMVALKQDTDAIKAFLEAVCEDKDAIPWDLR